MELTIFSQYIPKINWNVSFDYRNIVIRIRRCEAKMIVLDPDQHHLENRSEENRLPWSKWVSLKFLLWQIA
jgi:hypothetical protein